MNENEQVTDLTVVNDEIIIERRSKKKYTQTHTEAAKEQSAFSTHLGIVLNSAPNTEVGLLL